MPLSKNKFSKIENDDNEYPFDDERSDDMLINEDIYEPKKDEELIKNLKNKAKKY